jgi:hypothetical protein
METNSYTPKALDDTPDTMDIVEELSEAVEESEPPYDLPGEDLFAVDGLGNEPPIEATTGQ